MRLFAHVAFLVASNPFEHFSREIHKLAVPTTFGMHGRLPHGRRNSRLPHSFLERASVFREPTTNALHQCVYNSCCSDESGHPGDRERKIVQ